MPAADARELGYPGFDGLGLPTRVSPREPYIYHFPDGNASLARLLVRSLVPDVARGHTMDDVVLAAFDYGKLAASGGRAISGISTGTEDLRFDAHSSWTLQRGVAVEAAFTTAWEAGRSLSWEQAVSEALGES